MSESTGAFGPDAAVTAGEAPSVPHPIEARAVNKTFTMGDGSELPILQGVDLTVRRGEAVAIIGESGAGKSTLLHILGLLDQPTAGEIVVGGAPVAGRTQDEVAALRNRAIGFVFQFHHLLREFSALENAMMPCLIAGMTEEQARARAHEVLDAVGLTPRVDHRPWQLSGGEQQRVAVARALANRPLALLADEPSGNLDERTSARLHDLLFEVRAQRDLSMVLVTHNLSLAARADRTLLLRDGVLVPQDV